MMKIRSFLSLLLLAVLQVATIDVLAVSNSTIFSSSCSYRPRDFFLITKSLARNLNFFYQNLDKLVLDAAVGTRILERQISTFLNSNHHQPSNRVRKLLEGISEFSRDITEHAILKFPGENVSLPWLTSSNLWTTPTIQDGWKTLEIIQPDLLELINTTFTKTEVLNEMISDTCIGQLFVACNISPYCFEKFLKRPHSKYSLTHQVIFLHVAQQLGCSQEGVFSRLDFENYSKELCTRVYGEALIIEEQEFPKKFQDLFAELVTVCSIHGYEDFLRPDWMYQILLWEQSVDPGISCFPDNQEVKSEELQTVNTTSNTTSRKRRSDVAIEFPKLSCSVHFTAVGIGALAMNLRYFLQTCLLPIPT